MLCDVCRGYCEPDDFLACISDTGQAPAIRATVECARAQKDLARQALERGDHLMPNRMENFLRAILEVRP